MERTSNTHGRRSVRLKRFDYGSPGAYFVTICTKDKQMVLGKVNDGRAQLSEVGEIVERCWGEIPLHFPRVGTDKFVVMPNHIHGILTIAEEDSETIRRGVQLNAQVFADQKGGISPRGGTLSVVVRTFKAAVTTLRRASSHFEFGWQRNYHEHVVRNEDDLNSIREYIIYNPLLWRSDRNNPDREPSRPGASLGP
jgi:REP element-mobilizing transposase RayT